MKSARLPALLLLAACLFGPLPAAGAGGQPPASLLIWPEYDTRPGQLTFLTLTNVNGNTQSGAIRVHLIYVDATTCLQTDLSLSLTPRDTVTFLANAHVPPGRRGYVYGTAREVSTNRMIDFDHLIGALLRVDGVMAQDWSVQTLGFRGKTAPGTSTDVDNDGQPDLDGVEYEKAPNRFWVPRFFGQHPEPAMRSSTVSELILFQPLVGLGVTTTTAFLVWNDNEEVYSALYGFTCWTRVRPLTISGAFGQAFLEQSNHNPAEVIGMPALETGWFEVRGTTSMGPSGQSVHNPPVLGVLVEMRPYSAADLPFIDAD